MGGLFFDDLASAEAGYDVETFVRQVRMAGRAKETERALHVARAEGTLGLGRPVDVRDMADVKMPGTGGFWFGPHTCHEITRVL